MTRESSTHGYPWLVLRLTYRRTNHPNMERLHLVIDTIDRLPQTSDRGIYLKQQLRDKHVDHRRYINRHDRDMPEVSDWRWRGGGG